MLWEGLQHKSHGTDEDAFHTALPKTDVPVQKLQVVILLQVVIRLPVFPTMHIWFAPALVFI